jgi:hypothetical protein
VREWAYSYICILFHHLSLSLSLSLYLYLSLSHIHTQEKQVYKMSDLSQFSGFLDVELAQMLGERWAYCEEQYTTEMKHRIRNLRNIRYNNVGRLCVCLCVCVEGLLVCTRAKGIIMICVYVCVCSNVH